MRGGRGGGKTRTGAETLAGWMYDYPGREWAVVAPTYADARDTCIEGRSGLLKILGQAVPDQHGWNRSIGELRTLDGSVVRIDGADDGALRVQGKNLAGCWADEVGLWRQWQRSWDESIAFAVRMAPGLIVATGTPKSGHPLIARFLADDQIGQTLLTTESNADNLDPAALADLHRRYAGTRLGRQELEGEWLDDVEGALWTAELIERGGRVTSDSLPKLRRIAVGLDPSTGAGKGDEAGIIVAGLGWDGRAYILDDRTLRASPAVWGAAFAAAYQDHECDVALVEHAFGQLELAKLVLRPIDAGLANSLVPMKVHAGKRLRAEPVIGLYEKGEVSHVGVLPALESEMLSWVPDESDWSPNRIDALVLVLDHLKLSRTFTPSRVDAGALRLTTMRDRRDYG